MNFEQFKTNVEQWQAERGIYAHSTALAQALKAASEAGELADAVIKGDRDALKDSVGDAMVCIVGVAKMTECYIGSAEKLPGEFKNNDNIQKVSAIAVSYVTDVSLAIALDYSKIALSNIITNSIYWLNAIAVKSDLTLMECCESAWNEIKDRKGKMVAGGAFVKDEFPEQAASATNGATNCEYTLEEVTGKRILSSWVFFVAVTRSGVVIVCENKPSVCEIAETWKVTGGYAAINQVAPPLNFRNCIWEVKK